jgi:5-methylcytosine-specific restriction enzyme A
MPSMPVMFRASNRPAKVHDIDRRAARPWRRWYGLARWKRKRAEQLNREPLCAYCEREGFTTPATVADHVQPHHGDETSFWAGDLQSLCKTCHDGVKAIEEGHQHPRGG